MPKGGGSDHNLRKKMQQHARERTDLLPSFLNIKRIHDLGKKKLQEKALVRICKNLPGTGTEWAPADYHSVSFFWQVLLSEPGLYSVQSALWTSVLDGGHVVC